MQGDLEMTRIQLPDETGENKWYEVYDKKARDFMEQIAPGGFAHLFIDDDGNLIYSRTSAIDDVLAFAITEDGQLEVTIDA